MKKIKTAYENKSYDINSYFKLALYFIMLSVIVMLFYVMSVGFGILVTYFLKLTADNNFSLLSACDVNNVFVCGLRSFCNIGNLFSLFFGCPIITGMGLIGIVLIILFVMVPIILCVYICTNAYIMKFTNSYV